MHHFLYSLSLYCLFVNVFSFVYLCIFKKCLERKSRLVINRTFYHIYYMNVFEPWSRKNGLFGVIWWSVTSSIAFGYLIRKFMFINLIKIIVKYSFQFLIFKNILSFFFFCILGPISKTFWLLCFSKPYHYLNIKNFVMHLKEICYY